eukprot:TRINITY_DN67041_c8_g3_i2.p1 TRINITY_DN67041_c8_g3~~TRINITY_DN67041_c8_g3_i2.p1  ORF type:complete len:125 (-),score=15.79 TRINITY_DN67041_c8_g3_i2:59-433(-)
MLLWYVPCKVARSCLDFWQALAAYTGLSTISPNAYFSHLGRTLTTPNGKTYNGVLIVLGDVADPRLVASAINHTTGKPMGGSWYYVAEKWPDQVETPWGETKAGTVDATLLWSLKGPSSAEHNQ